MLNGTTGENLSSITLTICCPRFKSSTPSTSFFISGLELMVPSPPSRSIPIAKFLIFLPIGPLDTEKAMDAEEKKGNVSACAGVGRERKSKSEAILYLQLSFPIA